MSTKVLPASGPGRVAGARLPGSPCSTPAARSRSTSARLRGSSANARTDAATTGPISGDRLQRLDAARPAIASIVRKWRASVARRLLADVADAERVDQPRQIVRLAALDLLDDVAADLAELARHGPLRPRLARRHDELLELRGVRL